MKKIVAIEVNGDRREFVFDEKDITIQEVDGEEIEVVQCTDGTTLIWFDAGNEWLKL